jgi:hypothetical protein
MAKVISSAQAYVPPRWVARHHRAVVIGVILILVVGAGFVLSQARHPVAPTEQVDPAPGQAAPTPADPTPATNLPLDFPTQPLPEGWKWVRITYKGADGNAHTWWAAAGEIPAGKVYAPFGGTAALGSSAGLVTVYEPREKTEIYEGDTVSTSGLEQGVVIVGIPWEWLPPIKDGDRMAVKSGQVLLSLEKPVHVLVWFRKGETRDYTSLLPIPLEILIALLNGG